MFGWVARTKRVEALEAELAAMRTSMADMAEEGRRRAEHAERLGAELVGLSERTGETEGRIRSIDELRERLERAERTAEDARRDLDARREQIDQLRGEVLRLGLRLKQQGDDADKAIRALIERMDLTRPPASARPE